MIFENIELTWQGQNYSIPANRVMGAIASVEEVVTLAELQAYAGRRGAPLGKLAMAYGALLRYAGAKITNEEVYMAVFKSVSDESGVVVAAITNVMMLMIPPALRRDIAAGDNNTGNAGEGGGQLGNVQAAKAADS
ncbi:MAG: hypothetical protein SGI91_01190 [Alphaproteobacteria bacterium]|nr:hypothetical protein [Alphaproteobacteria bacterium]